MNVSDLVAREKARLGLGRDLALNDVGGDEIPGPSAPSENASGEFPEDIAPDPKTVGDIKAEAGTKGKGPSAASVAVSALDFRLDQHGVLVHCRVTAAGRLEVTDAESQAALDAIALAVTTATGSTPSHEILKRELAPVRARAREAGRTIYVYNRVAPDGKGGYLVDLGVADGQVAHITALGWSVTPNKTTAFRRGAGYGALSVPVVAETPAEAWERVTGGLAGSGVSLRYTPIVAAMMVEWLRPDTPNPTAEIIGPAGSGKTTLAEKMASTVDPTTTEGLASVKLSEDAIAAAACNRYVLAYDNAGGPLKDDEQDLLCKVATGTVLADRKFYSQSTEFAVEVRAPVIITAVLPVITRADARSRTIRVEVANRLDFAGAREVKAEFEAAKAQLTGALFTLLSAGLAGLAQAQAQKYQHRLVDFEQLGESITAAVGWQPGDFRTLMAEHRRLTAEESAEASPVVTAIRSIIDELRLKAVAGAKAPKPEKWISAHGHPARYAYSHPDGSLRVGVTLKYLHSRVPPSPWGAGTSERSTSNSIAVQEPTLLALGITPARGKARLGIVYEFTVR
jgi:hypothetical protein